jgi:outer membrane protein OmpA-like peptidoglycan-associated protein
VLFAVDDATLTPAGITAVRSFASKRRLVGRSPRPRQLKVHGYTDSDGSDEHNLDLSQRRADSVRQALIDAGVPSKRVQATGEGESDPVFPDQSTPEAKAANRRVEIQLFKLNGDVACDREL